MRVFANFAVSLDGRIADKQKPRQRLGTPLDWRTMDLLRAQADVIVVGAGTLRAGDSLRMRKLPRGRKHPANAVVTQSGELPPDAAFWRHEDIMRFVFCPRSAVQKVQQVVRDRALIVAAGEERVEPRLLLERLKATGFERVLVEGGGELLRSFVDARLLQELYVTLTPWLVGGAQNPSLLGGLSSLSEWQSLRLRACKRAKNEVYLHYQLKGARRV